MTYQEVGTLAYFKSPKATKRTTFQDELQAAVSSRASRAKLEHYDYFDNDEDDFLNELIDSRKKRNAFKARKNKGKINSFEVSDDESTQSRRKKVSFLKTQATNSPSNDTEEPEPLKDDPSVEYSGSFSSQQSTHLSSKNSGFESTEPDMTGDHSSPSYQTSNDNLSLPLPSDNSVAGTPSPQEKYCSSVVEENSSTPASNHNHDISADHIKDKEPPKPKPRQRTFGLRSHVTEKPPEETASQDPSGPQTSSTSIPLSANTSSLIAWTDGDQAVSSLSKSSSKESHQVVQKSAWDSDSRDGLISDDNREPERNYSSSFQEFSESSKDHTDLPSQSPEKSFDTRTSSSKTPERPRSECSKVESKYLGALKVLDRKASLQESQPQTADSLRAAVYQEWQKKKREKSRENMQLKKKEELQKEQEKEKQEAKKEDARASYEAWKQRKGEILRAMAKERKDRAQRATQEKLEKRQSAIKMFENWKREHDHLLRDKYRKQKETENKLKERKQQKEEERKRDSQSAFSDWCEKKKNLLHEKLEMERKVVEYKAEEELYLKEEREKTALEMYENWLRRKDLKQKRQREQRRIQAELLDSQPPPWIPANKVIPFRK
ncbi:microtubule-associated protein 9 isoform X2 [Oryzias melastigma]|uniref:microtubule-associated protein 9 isoform X2 n=1 Tax=Oryzias melastigma TaxID=30732 RepID=UPI000CF804FC|nr:microtubule-associated protein 9 isoform X2 [Oryzias melastigma]